MRQQQSSIRQSKRNSDASALSNSAFNRKRLVKELLSLGNPKITESIADTLSLEVEKELLQKDEALHTPDVISNLVRFKLEEMGLIDIKPQKEKIRRINTEKAMKVTHPFMPQPSPVKLTLQSASLKVPKEKLQWSLEGTQAFHRSQEWLGIDGTFPEDPENFIDKLSQSVADVDAGFETFHDHSSTAVQFFNRMAMLDFIPGSLLFKTDPLTGKFQNPPNTYSFCPQNEKVYETLSHFSKDNTIQNTTLGLHLKNNPDSENAALLLLKLLKTSLDYKVSATESPTKQELYVSLADLTNQQNSSFSLTDENDHEEIYFPFSSFFKWVEEEENRKHFSLSLGVPGRTLPYLAAPESFEQNLVRIIHQHLMVNSSLRLYFIERCLEAMNTQGQEDRVPNPQSPGLYSTGEVVPSLFLNLSVMVKDEEIDWDRLRRAVRQAVHFLDNVIDFWSYPDPESEKITKSNRSISLGLMGLADLLFTLRIPYNSQEALDLAARVAEFIEEEAIKSSSELAKSRGVFPNYIGSRWQEKGIPVRNAQICSLNWDPLPSLIAQTSLGIEAHQSLVELEGFEGEKPKYLIHPFLAQTARKRGFFNDKILSRVLELRSVNAVQEIPDDIRKVFVCNTDINLHWHLLMAATFEKYFDYGVSKICPISIYSEQSENIQNLLDQARELGLKSLWIKREGDIITPPSLQISLPLQEEEISEEKMSEAMIDEVVEEILPDTLLETLPLETEALVISDVETAPSEELKANSPSDTNSTLDELSQLLPTDTHDQNTEEAKEIFINPRPRPESLHGLTRKHTSCCGDFFITLNQDEQGPYEILSQLSKTFGNETSLLEVISKLISLAIQSGVHPQRIYEQLHGTICLRHLNTPLSSTASPVEVLANEISKLIPPEVKEEDLEEKTEVLNKEALAS